MPQAELAAQAQRMRTRIAEGRYAEAQAAFEEYCRSMAGHLAGLPPGDPRRRQLADDWGRLLRETERRIRTGRAHAALRLARLCRLSQPYAQPAPGPHTWESLA